MTICKFADQFERLRLEQLFNQEHHVYKNFEGQVNADFDFSQELKDCHSWSYTFEGETQRSDDFYLLTALLELLFQYRRQNKILPFKRCCLRLNKGTFHLEWFDTGSI
jgi:hypothetical protein